MKNKFKISLFITIVFLSIMSVLSITKVNAAYAYAWSVDDETLHIGSSNKAGTASWTSDDNYTGGVLTLKNYNGGQLKIDCYGTGLGHVFAVKLVGDNKITVDKGIGIIANVPVIFIGDGKLTINAAIPIGSGSISNNDGTLTDIEKVKYAGMTTITIEPSTTNKDTSSSAIKEDDKNSSSKEKEENSTKEDDKNTDSNKDLLKDDIKTEPEKDSFLDSNLFKIIVLSYCVISLIAIIILIVKVTSKSKEIN